MTEPGSNRTLLTREVRLKAFIHKRGGENFDVRHLRKAQPDQEEEKVA